MAVTSLNIAQSLRVWNAAGLTHILADMPVTEVMASMRQQQSVARQRSVQSGEVRSARPDAGFLGVPVQKPSGIVPTASALDRQKIASYSAPQSVTEASAEPSLPPASSMMPLLPQEEWPVAWKQVFAKSQPAPIVWTYSELGLDLSGAGLPERGQLLRKLIAALQLPRGTSTFWPSALSSGGEASFLPAPEVYFAGLQALSPRVVILLGESALTDVRLEPSRLPLLQQAVVNGRLFVHAPPMAALLESERSVTSLISLLRAVVGTLHLAPTAQ